MVQSVLVRRCVVSKHSATKLTYEDYLAFPEDGFRHEIIEGEHYVSPPPLVRHQRILLRVTYLIQGYLETHAIGEVLFAPVAVLLSEFNIFEPDLLYLSHERAHQLTEKNLQGAPDLVVEILSPSTKSRDKRLKREVYERTGVDEYWIVDPDLDLVDVYRRDGERLASPVQYRQDQLLTLALLPGLEIPLEKVFA
jgi:Uma2 family endonuclease